MVSHVFSLLPPLGGGVGGAGPWPAGWPRPYLVRGAQLSPYAVGQYSGSVHVEHTEGPTPHTYTCAHIHKHVFNIHVWFRAPLTPDQVHTTHLYPRTDTGAHRHTTTLEGHVISHRTCPHMHTFILNS